MSTAQPGGQSPLPVELAAVWGAFLLEGLLIHPPLPGRIHSIIDRWPSGFIELVTEVCGCLQWVWEEVREYWHHPEMFDGVFEYEVVSVLGQNIGDHILSQGCLPSTEHIQDLIAELVEVFFCTQPPLMPASRTASRSGDPSTEKPDAPA